MMENANDAMTELMTRTRASKENAITTPGQMRHAAADADTPRPLIIAEQRMSREANERHEHRSHARSNHSRPPRRHHRRSLLPRPGAGEQARGSQMRKS